MTNWLKEIGLFLTWLFNEPKAPGSPKTAPQAPITPKPVSMNPDDIVYPWDTPQHIYHNFRVECDKAGLSVDEKNLLCACVYQESQFINSAVCRNKDKDGNILSSDWGICQINDYYHCGPGKDFPSAEYVVANPDKAAIWMIHMYKMGLLKQWVSFSSGAYRKWLRTGSPMWLLKS